MDSREPTQEAYVVSDLHIGGGDAVDYFHRFGRDALFVPFVSGLPRCDTTLVLNGDIFDFARIVPLEVPENPEHLLWDEDASLLKLEVLIRNHQAVIQTLAEFISGGGRIEFVMGNHDFDIAWPKVRERLLDALGDSDGIRTTFSFSGLRWGTVLIEHGHVHTSESCPMNPAQFIHRWPNPRSPDNGDPCDYLERVWSTDFVLHVTYELERRGLLLSGRVGPPSKLLLYALRQPATWIRPSDVVRFVLFLRRRKLPFSAILSGLTVRGTYDVSNGPAGVPGASSDTLVPSPDDLVNTFQSQDWQVAMRSALAQRDFNHQMVDELERLSPEQRALLLEPGAIMPDETAIGCEGELLEDNGRDGSKVNDSPDEFRASIWRGWEKRAANRRLREGASHVIFGHSHHIISGELNGRLFNPGSWLPYLDLSSPEVEREIRQRDYARSVLDDEGLYTTDCHAVRIKGGGERIELLRIV